MMNKRHSKILDLLAENDTYTVNKFSEILEVSSVTVRQDLNFLESEGFLKRVHGGAVLKDADDIANRLGLHYERKIKIARKAASFVNEGETILIESGSINALFAREIAKKKQVTIITTNAYIARQFRKNSEANIILLGGIYQHLSESMVGKITKTGIDQVNFSKAFLGIDGFTTESGFTLRDLLRSEISSYIIKKAKKVFIVTDSSKFGKTELTNICDLKDIHHLITDDNLSDSYHKLIQKTGVDITLV